MPTKLTTFGHPDLCGVRHSTSRLSGVAEQTNHSPRAVLHVKTDAQRHDFLRKTKELTDETLQIQTHVRESKAQSSAPCSALHVTFEAICRERGELYTTGDREVPCSGSLSQNLLREA